MSILTTSKRNKLFTSQFLNISSLPCSSTLAIPCSSTLATPYSSTLTIPYSSTLTIPYSSTFTTPCSPRNPASLLKGW